MGLDVTARSNNRRGVRHPWALVVLACAALSVAQSRADELSVADATRTYQIHIPDGIALPAPAMVLLHGGGGSGAQFRRYTDFNDLADDVGIIAIYPDGIDHHWNDGRANSGIDNPAVLESDDVGFILALIDHLAEDGVIDPARVGVAGISNGGMMTLRLACAAPERFAAFAVIAANIAVGIECPDGAPAAMLFVHGTDDPLIPYDGGKIGFRSGKSLGMAWSVEATLDAWALRNRCTGKTLARHIDERPWDGTEVDITDYTGCAAPLRHVLIDGGGHTWPGTGAQLLNLVTGRSSREIDGNEAVWDFVAAQF